MGKSDYYKDILTKKDFNRFAKGVWKNKKKPKSFAIGIRRSKGDVTLDVRYPVINFGENFGALAVLFDILGDTAPQKTGFVCLTKKQLSKAYKAFYPFYDDGKKHENIEVLQYALDLSQKHHKSSYAKVEIIIFCMFKDEAVQSAEEGYFKLQALSQRHVRPNDWNLDDMFGKLTNVAWTSSGPVLPEDIEYERHRVQYNGGHLHVYGVDKIPYMMDYHIPSGVRIAHGARVRLGAYLGKGTTVMQEGFMNFNAGTEGNAMIEGRISAGVFVKKDTDIGGGASIMGTLSGGNKHKISIGEKCLLGANSGIGISLGNGCTVEAGLYVTGGTKILCYNESGKLFNPIEKKVVTKQADATIKAAELSGRDNLLLMRDSTSGKVICKPNPKTIELNADLHKND